MQLSNNVQKRANWLIDYLVFLYPGESEETINLLIEYGVDVCSYV